MKTFKELYEVSVVQRKKLQRRMAKMAKSPITQMKKRRAALKMRTPAKIAQLARKKTIQIFRDKFYPGYKGMGLQQRVKVDQIIMQKYGAKIDKVSKKVAMKLQKSEGARIKKAKEAQAKRTQKDA